MKIPVVHLTIVSLLAIENKCQGRYVLIKLNRVKESGQKSLKARSLDTQSQNYQGIIFKQNNENSIDILMNIDSFIFYDIMIYMI